MPRGPRIKDIASQLGVSIASVSRALNDKPGVTAELRQRILAAATALEFSPNGAARSLSGARTRAIAFVVHQQPFPAASDPFYFLIMQGLERTLAQQEYHIILTTIGARDERQANDLRVVREGRIDGLILAGPDVDASLILSLSQRGYPLVLVDNALDYTALACVLCDNEGGARRAVEHLIEHGHQAIAFVGGPLAWLSTSERQAGYEAALRMRGFAPTILHEAATTAATGFAAGQRLFAQAPGHPLGPTAVFAVNDAMALGIIRAARAAGLRVPADVAVVGFDDIHGAETADPPLTTVHIAKERMGELAAQHLLDLIATQSRIPVKSIVGTALVLRASCGCTTVGREGDAGHKPPTT